MRSSPFPFFLNSLTRVKIIPAARIKIIRRTKIIICFYLFFPFGVGSDVRIVSFPQSAPIISYIFDFSSIQPSFSPFAISGQGGCPDVCLVRLSIHISPSDSNYTDDLNQIFGTGAFTCCDSVLLNNPVPGRGTVPILALPVFPLSFSPCFPFSNFSGLYDP